MSKWSVLVLTCGFAMAGYAKPLNVCLVSGSFEYDSDKALTIFKDFFEARYDAQCVLLKAAGWDNIPGLDALGSCDVALFYTRRLTIAGEQLERIQDYCIQGKPIVAVRTASHGFQNWLAMDKELLGGNYQGHYDEGPTMSATIPREARDHPVLEGVVPFRSRYSLYKNPGIASDAQVLLTGSTPEHAEPIAWARLNRGGRVFYTSLGGVEDFENATFQRLIANALFWAANRDVARKPLPDVPPRSKPSGILAFEARSRTETPPGSNEWKEVARKVQAPVAETAILICDMWDRHWCKGATARVDALAKKMAGVIDAAHAAGLLVIHAPSETLYYYDGWPQRRRAQTAPRIPLPEPVDHADPPLPIDDSDGGCDTEGDVQYAAWRHQHGTIPIGPFDIISDSGPEIYRYMQQEGISTLIIMGVHTNMCVLGRSFGIKQMTRWGKQCYLVRDLTDTMYNPKSKPYVSHDEGTELVVRHIEKYWCPSLTSQDLLNGLKR
jgi:type 1 glutamine amidotransferase/nicotinamidase-related amidase